MVIHGASVDAVHEHPAGAVTLIVVPLPPPAAIASCVGDTPKEQDGDPGGVGELGGGVGGVGGVGAACCVTVAV